MKCSTLRDLRVTLPIGLGFRLSILDQVTPCSLLTTWSIIPSDWRRIQPEARAVSSGARNGFLVLRHVGWKHGPRGLGLGPGQHDHGTS